MWQSYGPDGGHHFRNFYKHCSTRDCLWDHFEKSEASGETLSGISGKVMVLIRVITFSTFINMVWQVIVFGTFLVKVKSITNLSRICRKVMVLIGAIIFQTSTSMVWKGFVLGTILKKKKEDRETT